MATWEVWVKLGEKGHAGVVTACGGAATAASVLRARALPSTVGTEDLAPVSSKQGEQKSSPCLIFWGIQ